MSKVNDIERFIVCTTLTLLDPHQTILEWPLRLTILHFIPLLIAKFFISVSMKAMEMFAIVGADLVPIAIPMSWMYNFLSNLKIFIN